MGIAAGFHTRFRSDLYDEITLAENLYIGVLFRWGKVRLPKVVRTNPATAFRALSYARVPALFDDRCGILHGWNVCKDSRASNDEILSPSHHLWPEFLDRLNSELVAPDFAWRFGPATKCKCGNGVAEYWPLASASIVCELGCAVAESLALFAVFLGGDDSSIAEYVDRVWRKTKARPGFIPFDEIPG